MHRDGLHPIMVTYKPGVFPEGSGRSYKEKLWKTLQMYNMS